MSLHAPVVPESNYRAPSLMEPESWLSAATRLGSAGFPAVHGRTENPTQPATTATTGRRSCGSKAAEPADLFLVVSGQLVQMGQLRQREPPFLFGRIASWDARSLGASI